MYVSFAVFRSVIKINEFLYRTFYVNIKLLSLKYLLSAKEKPNILHKYE